MSRFFAQLDLSGLPQAQANNGTLSTVLNIVFGIMASVTVLIIVIAGLRYIIARGDPNATAQAKNTIIYAVIGLVVILASYSIVIFVIKGIS